MMDLTRMTPTEFEAFNAGYTSGYLAADEAAERRNDMHWDALHHEAYLTVQAMAKLPAHAELERQRSTYTRPAWATNPVDQWTKGN